MQRPDTPVQEWHYLDLGSADSITLATVGNQLSPHLQWPGRSVEDSQWCLRTTLRLLSEHVRLPHFQDPVPPSVIERIVDGIEQMCEITAVMLTQWLREYAGPDT